MKEMKRAVIIFARYPAPGKVKTRLAKTLGDKFATAFYKTCADHTFSEVNKSCEQIGANVHLFCSEESEIRMVEKWIGYDFNFDFQKGNDLGLKMANAFTHVFNSGYKKVIIIGTDAPDINSGLIEDAFARLENFDAVIGPSDDGGYYLLGLASNNPDLFEHIEWSTDVVFEKTLDKLKGKGMSYYLLKELTDIDTEEDLLNWLHKPVVDDNHPVKLFVEKNLKRKDFLP